MTPHVAAAVRASCPGMNLTRSTLGSHHDEMVAASAWRCSNESLPGCTARSVANPETETFRTTQAADGVVLTSAKIDASPSRDHQGFDPSQTMASSPVATN